MEGAPRDPLFGAAILKLTFAMRGLSDVPGFRSVYLGTLRDLGVAERAVDAYVDAHREELEAHIRRGAGG